MKLKNKILIIIFCSIIFLLSSCKKGEAKLINVQYNYSNILSYNISIPKSDNPGENLQEQLTAKQDSSKLSDLNYLSIGLEYSSDDVKILQMKLSNSLYNWTFVPNRIVENKNIYYGKKALLIPNNMLVDDAFAVSIYYNDGSIYNTQISSRHTSIDPLTMDISVYDKYLLINLNPKEIIKELDTNNAIKLDSIESANDSNYIIRIFNSDKIILEKEVSLKNPITIFESTQFKNADKILIEKKLINNKISGNLYNLIRN